MVDNVPVSCGSNPSELDIMMRVVDPCFDVIWAYTQTFDTSKVLDKLKKRAGVGSSGASVRSLASSVGTTMSEMRMNDKIALLEKYLRRVKKEFANDFFEDIVTAMMMNDNLYPGIRDLDFIARYLYRENPSYKGLVVESDMDKVTVANVFKYVFFDVVRFLLKDRRGLEAMKYITLPTKVSNASFDVARKRFCALVVEDVSIVLNALTRLSIKLKRQITTEETPKEPVDAELTKVNLSTLDAETQTTKEAPSELDVQSDVVSEQQEQAVNEVVEEPVKEKSPVTERVPKKVRRQVTNSTVNFPTPLGFAFNNFWSTQPWSNESFINRAVANTVTKSLTRSIAPSLRSYNGTVDDVFSDDDSD